MLALVTGVAGFIGSNLAERLIGDGWNVRGVDRFTAYYEETLKRSNLKGLSASAGSELLEADLLKAELGPMLDGVDVVFHQAAQPGVRLSWADGFRLYNDLNVNLTQRLLEAVLHRTSSDLCMHQAHRFTAKHRDGQRPRPTGPGRTAPTELRSLPANCGAACTRRTSTSRRSRCAISRCTARGSAQTWPLVSRGRSGRGRRPSGRLAPRSTRCEVIVE